MDGKIHIGTSGWSYDDWLGPFYPIGTGATEYLSVYAQHFPIVEVDSTYYRPPTRKMVEGWAAKTPAGFGFFVKTPGEITHKKVLVDCETEMEALLSALQPLGKQARCLLLQFGYFNRAAFSSAKPFFERLDKFLRRLANRITLAVEIRNKSWLTREYLDLLRENRAVAALAEHSWMPPIDQLVGQYDVRTGPFRYVRLIGDRQGIEKITTKWSKPVVDRSADLQRIAGVLRQIARYEEAYVFVNNHYAGHGPASCRELRAAINSYDQS